MKLTHRFQRTVITYAQFFITMFCLYRFKRGNNWYTSMLEIVSKLIHNNRCFYIQSKIFNTIDKINLVNKILRQKEFYKIFRLLFLIFIFYFFFYLFFFCMIEHFKQKQNYFDRCLLYTDDVTSHMFFIQVTV